jgi:hypothetical protein
MPYRKRFHRQDPNERPGIDLTDRDRELLRIAYDYEPATTEILNALAPRETMTPALRAYYERKRSGIAQSPLPRTRREVYRRLAKLFDHAYLDRRKLWSANDPTVHLIGHLGIEELVERFGYDRKRIDWRARNRDVGVSHLHHSLMISSFHCALTLASQAVESSIGFWHPDGSVKEYVDYSEEYNGQTYAIRAPIVPDAFFALDSPDTRSHFFLEADRTTSDHRTFLEKLKGYVHFGRQGLHRELLRLPGFDVLIVTKSAARRDNLCALAEEAFDRPKDRKLFWFATEKDTWRDALGKIRAEALLEPVWYVPGEDAPRALLTPSAGSF